MYKTFIAGLTALCLTFSTAAPARANGMTEDQIGKILFGLIATGIVAKIIENNQSNSNAAIAPNPWMPHAVEAPRPPRPHIVETPRPSRPHLINPLRHPRGERHRMVLPRNCVKTLDTQYGSYRLFQRNCMRKNYRFVSDLPRRCEVRIVTHNGPRNGWDPRCLREAGYTARRR